jgi:threonine synthase
VPATALRCRVCETQYSLDPIGVCAKCFGPLDPVYDRDEQRRTVTRASIEAGPPSIWRYADSLPAGLRSSGLRASSRSSGSESSG